MHRRRATTDGATPTTSPSRGILSQHHHMSLNPFYFDFTKNHCECCPHDDPLLILFHPTTTNLDSTNTNNNVIPKRNISTTTTNIINKKSVVEEYRKLIEKAIIQYERLEIESALGLLKQAIIIPQSSSSPTMSNPNSNNIPNNNNCPTTTFGVDHFLAPLLYAQIIGDTIHDETLMRNDYSCSKNRLDQALEYIQLAREQHHRQVDNNNGGHNTTTTVNNIINTDEGQTGGHSVDERLLKRIECWIDSIEHYVRGNFEEMKKTSAVGILIGEEVYSKLNCSRHQHHAHPGMSHLRNQFHHGKNMEHSVSLRKMKNHNQQHIFQHNFEKDVNFIYQHYRDVSMGELWRLQFIALNRQYTSRDSISPDQLRMQYRYLCKSMAFGNLVPSRVLCQIALICNSLLEQSFSNSAHHTHSSNSSSSSSTSSDEELMLRVKIHDLVFHNNGDNAHGEKKMNMTTSLKTLKEANLFSKRALSPSREHLHQHHVESNSTCCSGSSSSRLSLSEQYFQDSFLLNGRGSFYGSIECALGDPNHITNNLTKIMRLFPVEGKFNPILHSLFGYCLYKDGEDKRSEGIYSRIMSLHPNAYSIYKSMNEKFYLLCYRFFLLSEERFVEQVETLFKRILNLALERSTSDRLIYLVRGQQRCFLSLIPNYYDNSLDIEQKEDEIQRTIESMDFYSYLSTEEQVQGFTCKYTRRMRDNLFRISSHHFTDLAISCTTLDR